MMRKTVRSLPLPSVNQSSAPSSSRLRYFLSDQLLVRHNLSANERYIEQGGGLEVENEDDMGSAPEEVV